MSITRLDVLGVCAAVAVGTVVGVALIVRDAVTYLLRDDGLARTIAIPVNFLGIRERLRRS